MQAITWPALVGVCRTRPRALETFSGSLKKRIQSILWTHNVSKLSVWDFNASGSRSCSGLVLLHPPCAGGTGGLRFWGLCVASFQNTTERLQNKSLEDSNLSQAHTLLWVGGAVTSGKARGAGHSLVHAPPQQSLEEPGCSDGAAPGEVRILLSSLDTKNDPFGPTKPSYQNLLKTCKKGEIICE